MSLFIENGGNEEMNMSKMVPNRIARGAKVALKKQTCYFEAKCAKIRGLSKNVTPHSIKNLSNFCYTLSQN